MPPSACMRRSGGLSLAMRDIDANAVLAASRDEFLHYIDIEEHHITEPREA